MEVNLSALSACLTRWKMHERAAARAAMPYKCFNRPECRGGYVTGGGVAFSPPNRLGIFCSPCVPLCPAYLTSLDYFSFAERGTYLRHLSPEHTWVELILSYVGVIYDTMNANKRLERERVQRKRA